ncbi:hypothetical protein HUK65_14695 [Rhodobacteraceae bacterium 2376]|uniref:D-sorbitol dehydrogenase-like protein n=1 Tax=Rhabdonatronobacter sediminivivens TaxID=2743469 RepID=A0A7Z0I1I4_9RHOB|nr:sugar dehydrogenase complex small subunit [Rhabdonatronobacter sediminivivens]NYS26236.1 hypothetical protein [Rhabdonatronobacter sediminivivens]
MTPPTRRAVMGGMIVLYTLALARIALAQAPLTPLSGPITPDAFLDLSRRLTGHDDLSPVLGARILGVLTETGQAQPLRDLYLAVSEGGAMPPMEDADILHQILHGWYLGRITVGDRTHLTGFEETLMGRVTADILPLRSYCGGAMGFWAAPPATGPLPLREEGQ